MEVLTEHAWFEISSVSVRVRWASIAMKDCYLILVNVVNHERLPALSF